VGQTEDIKVGIVLDATAETKGVSGTQGTGERVQLLAPRAKQACSLV